MEQVLETQEQENEQILRGEILSFSYNQIHIKEDETGQRRSIYFDGLQKRVLSDFGEEILSRLKRIEFVGENFWDMGINLLVCCDKCKTSLFSVCVDDGFEDKNVCADCEKWVCSDCFNFDRGVCEDCLKKQVARVL